MSQYAGADASVEDLVNQARSNLLGELNNLESYEEKVAHINARTTQLDQAEQNEAHRYDQLFKQLNAFSAQGCALEQNIDRLTFKVTGDSLGQKTLKGHLPKDLYTVSRDTKLMVELGMNANNKPLSISVPQISAFFSHSPHFQTNDLKNFTIGDIDYIRIIRPNFYIVRTEDNNNIIQTGTFGNTKDILKQWKFTESHRYILKGIEITVTTVTNDRNTEYTLYHKNGLSIRFAYPNRYFFDAKLINSDTYQRLLRKEDCT